MARTPPITDAAAVRREIDRLSALSLDDLRAAWRVMFRKPGKGLSRQLLLRTMAWEIQERAFGGYDKETEAALRHYANGAGRSAVQKRRLQAGTLLVREYQGTRHTVTVAAEGFIWQGQCHKSLSGIARAITGTQWNGHRFFGLLVAKDEADTGKVKKA